MPSDRRPGEAPSPDSPGGGVNICGICQGARFVCVEESIPWHNNVHCEHAGTPCVCNPGPDVVAWNDGCLLCMSLEEFMTLNPEDPDAILAEMEKQFEGTAISEGILHPANDPVNVQTLTDAELSERFNACRDRLIEINEMIGEAKTQEGRELHSERAAYLIEMQRRGWK
jgi:hypothetical protein